jgi:hypothetical protein
MRVTVTLDSDLEALLRQLMHERGTSFQQTLNDVIRESLTGISTGKVPSSPFRTPTANLGLPAVNLDPALDLAAQLEDEQLLRKMVASGTVAWPTT